MAVLPAHKRERSVTMAALIINEADQKLVKRIRLDDDVRDQVV